MRDALPLFFVCWQARFEEGIFDENEPSDAYAQHGKRHEQYGQYGGSQYGGSSREVPRDVDDFEVKKGGGAVSAEAEEEAAVGAAAGATARRGGGGSNWADEADEDAAAAAVERRDEYERTKRRAFEEELRAAQVRVCTHALPLWRSRRHTHDACAHAALC